ncbi:thioredoxin domain-containing protein [Corynebacterium halotolerans]|uniref:TlpA family protein disulfide reductase n=1 Tax=Corynebacterium halotolerans TaxID=225326 RepID=UPI003CF08D62
MRSSMKWYAVGVVVVTLLVVLAVPAMLRSVNEDAASPPASTTPSPAPESAPEPSAAPVAGADRPDCRASGVAGVDLPCLGGGNGATAADTQPAGTEASVVNLWAWWCGPCRDELPILEEFADAHPEYDVVGVHADAHPDNGIALLEDLDVALPSYQDNDNLFAGTLGLPAVVPITLVVVDGEQVAMFPQPFKTVAELEAAVSEAVA